MDIKILDSWLREYLQTKAKPKDIAKALSLTSASVEKIEEFSKDYLYHIEVTTNRIDMASVVGIAREAAAVLPLFGFDAKFIQLEHRERFQTVPKNEKQTIEIINNDKLVKRITCIVLEVTQKESPQYVKDRLEAAGVRGLNNIIDVTNYVMLEIGHPTHAFDYDRLTSKKLIIREAKKGEKIVTLDKKQHTLHGGDIVADNGSGEIVDLLGVMGTYNSVVTNDTKHVLFFIDNNDPVRIRKTSMSLGIRTEAAGINEKDVDPELAMPALLRGINLYQQIADAKVVSDIIDIYPHPWKPKTITVNEENIKQVIGLPIPLKEAKQMLERLGFGVKLIPSREGPSTASSGLRLQGSDSRSRTGSVATGGELPKPQSTLEVTIPSWRDADMHIAEDVIEEIARMHGYHNLPSVLPPIQGILPYHYANEFYWEQRAKETLKYWGFTEVYTYSMVSERLLSETPNPAVKLKNPLDEEHVYMRTSLTPSLLQVIEGNKNREEVKIFEIANIYHKKSSGLPNEIRTFAGVIVENGFKPFHDSFFYAKGMIEQLAADLGIDNLIFNDLKKGGLGADIYINNDQLGTIEVSENNITTFELNFALFIQHATLRKTYTPIPKYPPLIEDMAFTIDTNIKTGNIISEIQKLSPLIVSVTLLDQYRDKRTFHILYQAKERNLTSEDITKIREKIVTTLEKKFNAKVA